MDAAWLSQLNEQQRVAAVAGDEPLLIIAGAGTGKTNTLAHRVAHLIARGVSPSRILLLTFTRRASAEMLKRVEGIVQQMQKGQGARGKGQVKGGGGDAAELSFACPLPLAPQYLHSIWGGTFHAVANRLLRMFAKPLGLGEEFTVIDRSDAEDLMNVVRSEIGLDKGDARFPRKGTCMSVYSRCVNAAEEIDDALAKHFPWVGGYGEQLRQLFRGYVERKQQNNVLDYDDLLLYWFHLMADEGAAAEIRSRFDAVLVDEYQDTNALQAEILRQLKPDGRGVTVVGDDAQSIYSFRAATVHNILDFPKVFPGTVVVKLEQNYRSVQPILEATNAVIGLCSKRYNKDLFSHRKSEQKPKLVSVVDEDGQSDWVIRQVLQHLEAGVSLKKQAVLFRAAHHSDALEVELAKRNVPFVKYGGLKFLEAAHVKDVLSFLRLAENPKDATSAFRVLQLLDGVGPASAKKAVAHLAEAKFDLKGWRDFAAPAAAAGQWGAFVEMMVKLAPNSMPLADQVGEVKGFYGPILERRYDQAPIRKRDIDQLEQIAGGFKSRSQMLSDLALDPPASTQDLAGPPLKEEDYLILSTIHSAKGCEWDAVYVLHAADGNIPSDMATGSEEEVEEERRLFYVALTRAKDFLYVMFPLRYYAKKWSFGDRHSYAQVTRFLPDSILDRFERVSVEGAKQGGDGAVTVKTGVDIRKKISSMWG